jgi:hypothetical protein
MSENIFPLAGIEAKAVRRLTIFTLLDLVHERNKNVVKLLMIAASIMATPDVTRNGVAFKFVLSDLPRCIGAACFSSRLQ